MKVVSIEAFPFSLPVRREFRWNGLQQGLGQFVLVKVTADSGLVGYGEAVPLPDWGGDFGRRGGETGSTVISMVNSLFSAALLGRDPCALSEAVAAMEQVVVGHTYAKCAVEMALHDLWGKCIGQPLYRLLGGAVRDAVPIAHMVGLMGQDEAVAEAAGLRGAAASVVLGVEVEHHDLAAQLLAERDRRPRLVGEGEVRGRVADLQAHRHLL